MTPEQRRFSGIMLFTVGIISLCMAGLVTGLNLSTRADAAERFVEEQRMCVARLNVLGGTISDLPGRIEWTKTGLERAPALLGESSVASVMCPGWTMTQACVGMECPVPNSMNIVLEPMNKPE
ncbi:MAG: hypothetical protein CL949_00490 [Erythrobacter sp.]|nr:hypothetical protein [Erythrobacter sp.]